MQGKYLLNYIYIFAKNIFSHAKIYKRLYVTCESLEYNLITSAFKVDFLQSTSDFQTL